MGLFDCFCDAVGSVFSAVGDVCRTVINTAVSITDAVGTFVGEVGRLSIDAVSIVVGVVLQVCQAIGLIEQGTPEEIGDKILQAEEEGITENSCKNFEEYSEKIRNFEVNPNKSKNYSVIEKTLVAGVYCEKHLVDKFGFGLGKMVPLIAKYSEFQNHKTMVNLLDSCAKKDFSMDTLAEYLSGNLTGESEQGAEAFYNEAMKN